MSKKGLKNRKRREQTIAILIVAAVVLIATAAILMFAASKNQDAGEHNHEHEHETTGAINLKVSLEDGEDDIHYASVKSFKEEVEKRTDGQITITIHGNRELGTGASILNAMEKGENEADIVITSVSDFVLLDARMDISALPFAFENYDEATRFMEGSIQKNIEAELVKKNVRILAHYSDGFEHLSANQPVSSADSVAGLAITGTDDKFLNTTIKALNAKPVLTTEGSASQMLMGKQANAYMGSLESMVQYRIYQDQRYLAMTYHKYEALAFAISENTWKKMTEEQKEILQTAAMNSATTDLKNVKQSDENLIQRMTAAGMHLTYPKMDSFTEKAVAIIRGYQQKYGSYTESLIADYMSN